MCTETFLRLPEEKRNRFLEAAWEEFSSVPFEKVSINKIVLRAKIPRGSFYQYFAGKEDLFAYLQEIGLKYVIGEYCDILHAAGGDIFKTQLICFDRLGTDPRKADLLLERCYRIMRMNPSLLPQLVMEGKLLKYILESVWDSLDTSALRSKEPAFVASTFGIALVALAGAAAAYLDAPEKAEEHRQVLLTQLDIVKQGSLADACRSAL